MTTPELLEFIRIEHALGMSLAEITRLLVTEGEWDHEDVAEAFRTLGLPEEQAEEAYEQKKVALEQPSAFEYQKSTPPAHVHTVETTPVPAQHSEQVSSIEREPVVRHAPTPVSAPGPKDMEYPRHAAPMQYVETPEEKPRPTLARPASLKAQTFRPLIRSTQNGMDISTMQKNVHAQHGPTIHVSKLQHLMSDQKHGPAPVPQIHKSKETIETKVVFGLDVPDEEPSPRKVATPSSVEVLPVHGDTRTQPIGHDSMLAQLHTTETKETKNTELAIPNPVTSKETHESSAHGEALVPPPQSTLISKFDLSAALSKKSNAEASLETALPPFEKGNAPVDAIEISSSQEKHQEAPPSPLLSTEQHTSTDVPVVDTLSQVATDVGSVTDVQALGEKKKDNIPQQNEDPSTAPILTVLEQHDTQKETVPQSVSDSKKGENTVSSQTPSVAPPLPVQEVPSSPVAPPVTPFPQPPVTPPVSPPQTPPPAPQPQIIVVPANMFGGPQGFQFPEMPMQMAGMQQRMATQQPPAQYAPGSRVAEMNGVSPDVEEQAYLAQFGQAPMPKGMERPPQATVVSPTIIYAPQMHAGPTGMSQSVPRENIIPPKPEPIRFDIGKVRSTQKNDKPNALLHDSIENTLGLDGGAPEKHVVVSPIVKPNEEQMAAAAAHSLKVPQKRTMYADLMRIGEGVIPEQVVTLVDKTDAVSGVALSDVDAFRNDPVPPPQKRVSTSIFLLAMSILIVLGLIFGIGYYVIVLKKPSAQSAFSGALRGLFQNGTFSYNAVIQVDASSTDALLESVVAQANIVGTVVVRDGVYQKGIHEGEARITHRGVPQPINLEFQGSIIGLENEVFLSQQKPTINTPMEQLLPVSQWLKIPYVQVGEMFGFSSSAESYTAVISEKELFREFFNHLPLIPNGSVSEVIEGDRTLYRIPVSINGKSLVEIGDLISSALRGTTAAPTDSARREILTARYEMIRGELIVDKLMLHPVRLTLQASFDPSKIPFQGVALVDVVFSYPEELPSFDRDAKTVDEYKIIQVDTTAADLVIAKDAPALLAIPTIVTALKQFSEKEGYYPLRIEQLFVAKYLNADALAQEVREKILYVPYGKQPKQGEHGAACVAKKGMCSFYHLATTLEHMKSSELGTDADITTPKIQGSDTSGCAGEQSRACFDLVGILE